MNVDAPAWPPETPTTPLAVLVSGGLDSAILLGEAVRRYPTVYPVYVRTGAPWEVVERQHLDGFLDRVRTPALRPLVVLDQPVADLYADHWGVTGVGVPDYDAPDEESFLPGRNVVLLTKPLLWCAMNGVAQAAMATLAANPFPDATPAFFAAMAEAVGRSMNVRLEVLRPYAGLHKSDVLARGAGMPLGWTLSCARPTADGLHCNACSKCRERHDAFRAAGLPDPTRYAERSSGCSWSPASCTSASAIA